MHRVKEQITVLNLSCVYSFLWGLFIANPYTDNFAANPSLFMPMTELVDSEVFWGGVMMAVGVAGLVLNRWQKKTAPLLMGVFFSFLASLFFLGDLERPGWALIGALAAFNFLSWRVARWTASLNG